MSSYHTGFTYMGKNSQDFNLIIGHFEPDNGEVDSFLSMEQVYTDSYDGTKRHVYGAKYSDVSVVLIPLVKSDFSNFSVQDVRNVLRWLTGVRNSAWLDLYVNDKVEYSFLGSVTNVRQYKMDALCNGIIVEFTSVSPWAYSSMQTVKQDIEQSSIITIFNETDDLYTYVYPKVVYKNTSGDTLTICNTSIDEETTTLSNIAINEVVTFDSNQFIYSDNTAKIYGNDFNYVFPRLAPGMNDLNISGNGNIEFTYRYPIKVGDCVTDVVESGGSGGNCGPGATSGHCKLSITDSGVLYISAVTN